MMSIAKTLVLVLAVLVGSSFFGCASCKDHLLVHIEHSETRAPAAGAKVEFRPPLNLLPPPTWRGRTDADGNLRICVDFRDGMLQMQVQHDGHVYRSMFGRNLLEQDGGCVLVQRPEGGTGPVIRMVVRTAPRSVDTNQRGLQPPTGRSDGPPMEGGAVQTIARSKTALCAIAPSRSRWPDCNQNLHTTHVVAVGGRRCSSDTPPTSSEIE